MVRYYKKLNKKYPSNYNTSITITCNDTLTEASGYEDACCLNFASHRRPGGGYKAVMDTRMPLRTQEEDLFRRTDLPLLMDNAEVHKHYPLNSGGLHVRCQVLKDKNCNKIEPFTTGIVSVPAVVNPKKEDEERIWEKIRLIPAIAAENGHSVLILGAWGCGVFGNDPYFIAKAFKETLENDYLGVFSSVIFAIPSGYNNEIFESIYN